LPCTRKRINFRQYSIINVDVTPPINGGGSNVAEGAGTIAGCSTEPPLFHEPKVRKIVWNVSDDPPSVFHRAGWCGSGIGAGAGKKEAKKTRDPLHPGILIQPALPVV
jgi:hypothetical protein